MGTTTATAKGARRSQKQSYSHDGPDIEISRQVFSSSHHGYAQGHKHLQQVNIGTLLREIRTTSKPTDIPALKVVSEGRTALCGHAVEWRRQEAGPWNLCSFTAKGKMEERKSRCPAAWCTVLSDRVHEQWKFQMMRKKKYLEYQVHLKSRKQYSADSTQAQGETHEGHHTQVSGG